MTTTANPAVPELVADLEGQLTSAVKLASTRAEHIRLTRMQSVLSDLKSAVTSAMPTIIATPLPITRDPEPDPPSEPPC